MSALELEEKGPNGPDRREDVIVAVEVNGTPVRIVAERWRDPRPAQFVPGSWSARWRSRYWVETVVGVFTPEQARAYAAAVKQLARRAAHLQAIEDNHDG